MTWEWIRFFICAVLMVVGIGAFLSACVGVNRYKFMLNRLHPASMADSIGVLCIMLSLIIYSGFTWASLKLAAILVIAWVTSPISGHLLAMIEVSTSDKLSENCKIQGDNVEK